MFYAQNFPRIELDILMVYVIFSDLHEFKARVARRREIIAKFITLQRRKNVSGSIPVEWSEAPRNSTIKITANPMNLNC